MSNIKLIQGDCLEKLRDIHDRSIDAVITDPPYGTTACKWDTCIPFDPMWKELKRVIKKNGAIVLFGSQPFTSALVMSNLKMFKYEWIWHKKTSANVANVKYQPLKTHENILVFGGGYKPQMIKGKPRMKGGKTNGGQTNGGLAPKYYFSDEYYPVSLLEIKTERGFHPTQKPVALIEYLIKTYTNECETVLDFTMGSGTTGVACRKLNRNFIGIELDLEYFNTAKRRIEQI